MNGMDEEKKRSADGMQNGGPSSDTAPETVSAGDGADIPTAEGSDVPPESGIPAADPSRKKKKGAIIFLAVLGVLAVVLALLNTVDFEALAEKINENKETTAEAVPVKTYPPTYFEIPDYNENLADDGEYLALDRNIYYSYRGETFVVERDVPDKDDLRRFWQEYFDAVTAGDAKAIDALCTDEYLKKNGNTANFAPQKVYNIKVELNSMQDLVNGDANGNYKGYIVYYFEVSYYIKDNNGTFRNDFFEDFYTVPLMFEVLEGNTVKINSIDRIRTGTVSEPKGETNYMIYIWIALIVLAIVAELLTTSLVAVWFIPAGIVSLTLAVLLPDQLALQIVLYPVIALLLLLLTRPFVKKRLQKGNYQPTNADRVIGMTAVVTEEIDNVAETGEVKVGGIRWTARSQDGTKIEKGAEVVVLEIEGVKLICRRRTEK
ncbi:MAG: NfeD family protein [Eubacteriales bacterium]